MKRRSCVLAIVPALAVMLTLAGCGQSGPERVVVSGTVTYRGQPIPKGFIRFVPIGETKGAAAGTSIVDGKYEVTNKGGVLTGKHRVEITAVQEREDPMGRDLVVMKGAGVQYLPAQYNTNTQLTAEIPSDGPVTKDFQLQ